MEVSSPVVAMRDATGTAASSASFGCPPHPDARTVRRLQRAAHAAADGEQSTSLSVAASIASTVTSPLLDPECHMHALCGADAAAMQPLAALQKMHAPLAKRHLQGPFADSSPTVTPMHGAIHEGQRTTRRTRRTSPSLQSRSRSRSNCLSPDDQEQENEHDHEHDHDHSEAEECFAVGNSASATCLASSCCSASSSGSASGSASGLLSSAAATPRSSPPPLLESETLSDADDVVRGMRASHINASPTPQSPAQSFVGAAAAHAAPITPHSEREHNSRKRRNSRLHASMHATPRVQAAVPVVLQQQYQQQQQQAAAVDPYNPGQNKRQQSSQSSKAEDAKAFAALSIQVPQTMDDSIRAVVPAVASAAITSSLCTVPVAAAAASAASASVCTELASSAAASSSYASSSHRSRYGVPGPSPTRLSLVSVLGCVLEQLFSNPADTLPTDPAFISMFHTERIPSIGIGRYLDRVAHYSECSEEALVMAFIHISRIYHANQAAAAVIAAGGTPTGPRTFQLNGLSIHRLLLIAVMASAKFFDDAYYNNSFYSRIGGVTLREINALEVEFLALIAFDLYIPARIYRRFYRELTNAQLHPFCACEFRKLPQLSFSEELPQSPAVDCDLNELMHGSPADDERTAYGVRRTPDVLPSPITPLDAHAHAFPHHGSFAHQQQQQQQQQPRDQQQHQPPRFSSSSAFSSSQRRSHSMHLDASETKLADCV